MNADTLSNSSCPVCLSKAVGIFTLNLPLFRHFDYHLHSSGETIYGQCTTCSAVFRIIDQRERERITAIYTSEAYGTHMKSDHMVLVDEFDSPVTPYFLQMNILRKFLNTPSPAILDVGCLDGAFLSEASNFFPSGFFVGYDVHDNTRGCFPKNANFKHFSGKVSQITGQFDLITLSHSIQYIQDVQQLMRELKRLLKQDGILYVQVPDYQIKPCSLLLGDLFYHHSENSLHNLLSIHDFEALSYANNWFSKDVVILAKNNTNAGCSDAFRLDDSFKKALNYLNDIKVKLKPIKKIGRLYILGTTIEASVINYFVDHQTDGFIDENYKKQGNKFLGKDVLSPEAIQPDDIVIVPYGRSGEPIAQRLEKFNKAKCLVI